MTETGQLVAVYLKPDGDTVLHGRLVCAYDASASEVVIRRQGGNDRGKRVSVPMANVAWVAFDNDGS